MIEGTAPGVRGDRIEGETRAIVVAVAARIGVPAQDARLLRLHSRHALSTALIAVRTAGLGHWQPGLNVSRLLAAGLDGTIGWLADPVFTALRAARQHTMIICDKTIANVLAYAWLVLPAPPGSREAAVLQAMEGFCRAWAGVYDAVFYCCDQFSQHQAGDPYRAKVLDLQPAAGRVVRSVCATVGQRVTDIPPGLTTAGRIQWITTRITKLGLVPGA